MKMRYIAQLFFSILIILVFYAIRTYVSQHPREPILHTTLQPTVTSTVLGEQTTHCTIHGVLPDHNCTPGTIDSTVTQSTIAQTICKSGYTTTVRPPVSYTNELKKQQIEEYGYTDLNPRDYEEDHLISLELGGSPTDPKNLWPEPGGSPNPKDTVENRCHQQVCNGQLTLATAQKEIATNWTTACE